jgi:DNA polymerase
MISLPIPHKNILVLDFETAWGTKYTLRSMATSEYVRDPRFKIHGVGVFTPLTNEKHWLTEDVVGEYFANTDWDNTALICHNTMFDGFVLHEHFDAHPAFYYDTLCMSRALYGPVRVSHHLNDLGKRLGLGGKEGADILQDTKNKWELDEDELLLMGEYCMRDVELTWDIFTHMLEEQFPVDELYVIDYTLRAFCAPRLRIDRALAEAELAAEQHGKRDALLRAGVEKDIIMSNDKFASELRKRGLPPDRIPYKMSKTTGERTYAFAKSDEDFLELLNDPVFAPLVEARLRVKSTIAETRAAKLLLHGDPGPLPIGMNYWRAHTGRWGGADRLNPQNFPTGRINGQTQRLRNAIIPPPGYVIITVDSSQIEARFLAWLAGNDTLLEVFRQNKDPYLHTASTIYQREMTDPKKFADERQLGKVVLLALGYGMGLERFKHTARIQFGMTVEDKVLERAHQGFRSAHHNTTCALWSRMDYMLGHMAYAKDYDELKSYKSLQFAPKHMLLSNGLAMWYPNLTDLNRDEDMEWSKFCYRHRNRWRSIYGAMLTENGCQAECRNIVAQQAIEIAKSYFICLLAHDEVVFLAKEDEADEAKRRALRALTKAPWWAPDLPLGAEAKIRDCYGK